MVSVTEVALHTSPTPMAVYDTNDRVATTLPRQKRPGLCTAHSFASVNSSHMYQTCFQETYQLACTTQQHSLPTLQVVSVFLFLLSQLFEHFVQFLILRTKEKCMS